MRTSPLGNSRKLDKNNAIKGAKFIGDSSPLARVVGLYNTAGLTSPAL